MCLFDDHLGHGKVVSIINRTAVNRLLGEASDARRMVMQEVSCRRVSVRAFRSPGVSCVHLHLNGPFDT